VSLCIIQNSYLVSKNTSCAHSKITEELAADSGFDLDTNICDDTRLCVQTVVILVKVKMFQLVAKDHGYYGPTAKTIQVMFH
jgi:hypothetical protein